MYAPQLGDRREKDETITYAIMFPHKKVKSTLIGLGMYAKGIIFMGQEREAVSHQHSLFFSVFSAVLQFEVAVLGCYGDTV